MPEKLVLKNKVFVLGSHRISIGTNSLELPADRAEQDGACYEDPGRVTLKGPYEHGLKLVTYSTSAEADIINRLRDEGEKHPFTFLTDSDAQASPVAAPGSLALFCDVIVTGAPLDFARGAVRKANVNLPSGGSRLHWGTLLYTNIGAAPLGVGVFDSAPQNVGELTAGKILAATFHVPDVPGVAGVGPTITAELLSDVDVTFATPISRHTFAALAVPGAYMVVIDGDVTPFPGEAFWAVRLTVGGVDPEFTVLAAIDVIAKET